MAICVALQADGTLVPTGESVDQCTGYVLVSGSEYGLMQAVNTAFAAPTTEQATSYFVGTFGIVVFFFVAARMAGSVAAMFK